MADVVLQDNLYDRQRQMAYLLYDCEPRGFAGQLTTAEVTALTAYYAIDVDRVASAEYRDQDELKRRAQDALHRAMTLYQIDEHEFTQIFG